MSLKKLASTTADRTNPVFQGLALLVHREKSAVAIPLAPLVIQLMDARHQGLTFGAELPQVFLGCDQLRALADSGNDAGGTWGGGG
jgi:hypothetical protein